MKKYYVEVWNATRETGEYPYLLQSKWYETEKECYNFINLFDYIDDDLRFSLMCADFDKDGNYGDIDCLIDDMIFYKDNKKK